ncbi:hypothetical protein SBA5_70023 [Candidatus Sulfotelmatomonas gaucii]|uniref:Uncharacterized protein n=1 Tax=Candidatus Sulfuritelmatomonas gaucii TaxID=2043161 RepID=A0A2N9M069_9BACT|nr:hypothetical protein SBA5_70023 [Candidatus Sulfotelmatomonas gaucii]
MNHGLHFSPRAGSAGRCATESCPHNLREVPLSPPIRGNAAAGNLYEPIVRPRPPWLQKLNPFENAIAAFYAGVNIQSHPIAEIHSARRSAFLR